METVQLKLATSGEGAFEVIEGNEKLGEMVISIKDGLLTVYHTEVEKKAEGRGLAKQMLNHMVEHARKNNLKVKPLCPYVHAQFARHQKEFEDIWLKAG